MVHRSAPHVGRERAVGCIASEEVEEGALPGVPVAVAARQRQLLQRQGALDGHGGPVAGHAARLSGPGHH